MTFYLKIVTRYFYLFTCGVLLILFSAPTVIFAQEGHGHGHGEAAQTMDTMVVTAERVADYIRDNPNLVEIVDHAEIEQRSIHSVEEALRTLPGVDVKQSTGIGARISIRGSGKSGGVLVLIDGRPMNSSQYGSADLSTIAIDTVQSITVFKPPVPVWLGPGGSDGAISIVTKAPGGEEEHHHWTKLYAAGGSYGLAEASVSHRLQADTDTYSVTAAGKHRDGKRTNSDRNSGNLSVHWDRKLNNMRQMQIDGRFFKSEYGSTGPDDNPTPDARQSYTKGAIDTRLQGVIGSAWDTTLNLYADKVGLEDKSQSGDYYTLDSTKLGAKAEGVWSDADEDWQLRLNGIAQREDVDHTTSGTHHRVTAGLGAQADHHWESLTATLGLRGDHTNDFDLHPGLSTGLSYNVSDHWTAKVNAGYQAQLPSFGQLYQPSHGSIDQVRGNPDLDEEQIWSYDMGIEYRLDKTHLFQLSAFRTDTRDPIVYQRGEDRIFQPVNARESWRQGLEATFKYGLDHTGLAGLLLDLNVIMQESRVRDKDIPTIGDKGNELPYTPEVKINGTVQYTVPAIATRLEATARYCAQQYSEVENREDETLDEYTTVDVKAIQPFKIKKKAVEWFITVNNVFDVDYEVHFGYPDDGIRFVTGVNVTL